MNWVIALTHWLPLALVSTLKFTENRESTTMARVKRSSASVLPERTLDNTGDRLVEKTS